MNLEIVRISSNSFEAISKKKKSLDELETKEEMKPDPDKNQLDY